MRLRELGEFGLIDRFERAARSYRGASVVLGIGDDAALLRPRAGEDVAVSTDALVEGVHFRFGTEAPAHVGRRAAAAALSDLAAMGARPLGLVLALAAPPSLDVRAAQSVVRGLVAAARASACPLVGGNVARAPSLVLTLTAVGGVARGHALTRGAGRPGDRLLVTGTLGGAALALARARRTRRPLTWAPRARLRAGRALGRLPGRGACIDVSDGLVADLRHLLRASRCGAELWPEKVPRPPGFGAACARLGLDADRLALGGGEDYELLFSVRPAAPAAGVLARRLGVRVTEIGRLERGRGLRGASPGAAGWTHF